MNAENRLKIKGYTFEKEALLKFIVNAPVDLSPYVKSAVEKRVRTVIREMEILGYKGERRK